jgi:threonine/homoserine/homoserine lactone efflux protein
VSAFGAFVPVVALVIVTPGPDTALTIRNTLLGGRGAGVFTALGVAGGQAVWSLATAAGIAAVLAASADVLRVVRLVGAAYLVFLGLQALWSALKERKAPPAVPRPERLPPPVALRQGLINNLTNPKMAAFFPAFLPQFVGDTGRPFFVLLALGLVSAAMTLLWLSGYAVAVAKAGDVLRRPSIRRAIEAVTGVVLVGLGLRLGSER